MNKIKILWLKKLTQFSCLFLAIVFVTNAVLAEPVSNKNDYRARMAGVNLKTELQKPNVSLVDFMPTGQEWITHLEEDIMPFWTSPAALGNPIGNFPTFRTNDGSVITSKNIPAEVKNIGAEESWILNRFDRQYARMASRQVFAYCVAYNLTGDEKYLKYAKAGVDYIFTKMRDKNGNFYSWMENGKGYPVNEKQRVSQDIAYAIMGPAAYYYLTRDPATLKVLLSTEKYIFDNYREGNQLRWVNQNFTDLGETNLTTQKELVAQLDQVNGYMLLTTTILEPTYRNMWLKDMLMLANTMKNDYYSPKHNLFWGRIDVPESKKLGQPHVDFGHTIKTLWMMYTIGNRFNVPELQNFALKHMPQVFKEAYDPNENTWIERKTEDGTIDTDKIWWLHDELDQTAATLSMVDPSYLKYLVHSNYYWFFNFVDLKNKETWHGLSGTTSKPMYLKAHLWKSAFHNSEHALVGYITAQAVRNQPVTLYYAFYKKPSDNMLKPYFFDGKIKEIKTSTLTGFPNLKKYTVTFGDIRP